MTADSSDNAAPHTRLLVVVNVVRPDLGGGVLFSDLFEGLTEQGIEVTVKCAFSYYPEWKDKSGQNGLQIRTSVESGVTIERHGLYIPRNPNSLLQRLFYEASFFLSLRRRMPARGEFDAVMVFCPLVGSVAYAGAVRKALGIPMWLNIQDLSAQAAASSGIADRSFVADILLRVQNLLFAHADLWTSISQPMIDVLEQHNPGRIPVRYAPNWLHPGLAEFIQSALQNVTGNTKKIENSVMDSGSAARTTKLFYSGNIGTKQNLLVFCKQLSALPARFSFRIQGAGGRQDELKQWIQTVGDERFEFFPLSDEESLARTLVECDYYVITENPGSGNAFIPSKLIPAITSKTPILAICDKNSPLGKEVTQHDLGPLFGWTNFSDPANLPAILSKDFIRSQAYSDYKNNCLSRSSFYDRETAIERYILLLTELLSGKNGKGTIH